MRIYFSILMLLFPSIVLASEDASFSGLMWRVLTFVLFVGILYKLLHKMISNGLQSAIDAIKKALKEAEAAQEDALTQLAEYTRKVDDMQQKLADMKSSARIAVEKEAEQIMAGAKSSAEKMRLMSKKAIEQEVLKASDDIKKETALAALELASSTIASSSDDFKSKFLKTNISKVGA